MAALALTIGCGPGLQSSVVQGGPAPIVGVDAQTVTVRGFVDKLPEETAVVRFLNLDGSPVEGSSPIGVDFSGAFEAPVALPSHFDIEATVQSPSGFTEVFHSEYHGDWSGELLRVHCLTELASAVYDLPSPTTLEEAFAKVRQSLGLPEDFDPRSSVEPDGPLFSSTQFRAAIRELGGFRNRSSDERRRGIVDLAQQVDLGLTADFSNEDSIYGGFEITEEDFERARIAITALDATQGLGCLKAVEEGLLGNPLTWDLLGANLDIYPIIQGFNTAHTLSLIQNNLNAIDQALTGLFNEINLKSLEDSYQQQYSTLTSSIDGLEANNVNLQNPTSANSNTGPNGVFGDRYPQMDTYPPAFHNAQVGTADVNGMMVLARGILNQGDLYSNQVKSNLENQYLIYAQWQVILAQQLATGQRVTPSPDLNKLRNYLDLIPSNLAQQRSFLPGPVPADNFVVDRPNGLVWFKLARPAATFSNAQKDAASFSWSGATSWRVARTSDYLATFKSKDLGSPSFSQIYGFDFGPGYAAGTNQKGIPVGRTAVVTVSDIYGFVSSGSGFPVGDSFSVSNPNWSASTSEKAPYFLVADLAQCPSWYLEGCGYLTGMTLAVDPMTLQVRAMGTFTSPRVPGVSYQADISDRVQWHTNSSSCRVANSVGNQLVLVNGERGEVPVAPGQLWPIAGPGGAVTVTATACPDGQAVGSKLSAQTVVQVPATTATVQQIQITPRHLYTKVNTSHKLNVLAFSYVALGPANRLQAYSIQLPMDVTDSVQWFTNSNAVTITGDTLTVNSSIPGTVNVTARYLGFPGFEDTITVSTGSRPPSPPAPTPTPTPSPTPSTYLNEIDLSPLRPPTLSQGGSSSLQFSLSGSGNGSTSDLTSDPRVTWSSSLVFATIANGLLRVNYFPPGNSAVVVTATFRQPGRPPLIESVSVPVRGSTPFPP